MGQAVAKREDGFDYSAVDAETAKFARTKAANIRALGNRTAQGVIAMGKDLKAVRDRFGDAAKRSGLRGEETWSHWCRAEAGVSKSSAQAMIKVFNKFGRHPGGHARGHLPTFHVLQYLAADVRPSRAVEDVLERAASGEAVTLRRAKEIERSHLPPPAKARETARETGKPQPASDGKLYFGATKEEEAEAEHQRELIYSVHDAIATLARQEIAPEELLDHARSWQLWRADEIHQIPEALKWLRALKAAWEARHGPIAFKH